MNNNLTKAALNLLDQLKSSIDQIQEGDFDKPCSILNDSTIGQHVRHTLEFFLCLIDAVSTQQIDYDLRKHDKFIEQDKKLALSVLNSIRDFVSRNPSNFEMEFSVNYDLDRESPINIKSNFHRELVYNIEHAIHHMALIKIGIKSVCPYVKIDPGFGVASSTIRYQKEQEHAG
ncbi:MAG: hypothetical protein O2887_15355 [Bacteroidetes bacterium]|nr:hypothetical protein [Bacteroidota bacterium]MDA1121840.1 hypothetical protein [Bacteroidota bacterium]